ncbi:hypothetical protein DFA_03259 [Cavenderia fasciculata]|uniref:Countin-like protein n=1 Tax=Cavenderia fasciculata TaxID=261658 RepID=F4PH29_CACFS|nr:uncharacterized protein DFA_03259 [Cavenderia fasciculata]EGG25013.1 hypothetical protein DFA_03259 [Cavenderia fasciculata]|eukprot:XP_004362864.1 hypothetical protein DFA_03259 [Cavenderia fasciculata]
MILNQSYKYLLVLEISKKDLYITESGYSFGIKDFPTDTKEQALAMKGASLIATILIVAFSAITCNSVQLITTCSSCYLSMSNSIYYLNQIIDNDNYNFYNCPDLCNLLATSDRLACNLTCESLGFARFVSYIGQPYADPIGLCQDASICPFNVDPTGYISALYVSPAGAPAGTAFNITMNFYGSIQAGQAQVIIMTPLGSPLVISNKLLINFNGTNTINFSIQSYSSSTPGSYQITGLVCSESCESNDEVAQVLDKVFVGFTIFPASAAIGSL